MSYMGVGTQNLLQSTVVLLDPSMETNINTSEEIAFI